MPTENILPERRTWVSVNLLPMLVMLIGLLGLIGGFYVYEKNDAKADGKGEQKIEAAMAIGKNANNRIDKIEEKMDSNHREVMQALSGLTDKFIAHIDKGK